MFFLGREAPLGPNEEKNRWSGLCSGDWILLI